MTGRAVPSDDELRARLHKRMFLLPSGPVQHGRLSTAPNKRDDITTSDSDGMRSKGAALVTYRAVGVSSGPVQRGRLPTAPNKRDDIAIADEVGFKSEIVSGVSKGLAAPKPIELRTVPNKRDNTATANSDGFKSRVAAGDIRAVEVTRGPVQHDRLPRAPNKRYNPATKMLDGFKAKVAQFQAANGTLGANGTAGNFSSASGASQGVSPIDIQAATAGGLTAANTPTTANSIGLSIEAADAGYVGQVQLGTPPKNFQILMDSGSADFWVGSETCQSLAGGGCGTHQFLGSQASSTFNDTKVPFNVTYGTGSVSGTVISDDVTMAGLLLKGHAFGTANVESVDFSADNIKFDGLMGLAQSGLSQQGVPTPIESLAAAGLVPASITSYKISRLADQKNDGEITFGALDPSKFDQATLVSINNVNAQGFWEGNMDAVSVNGQDTGLQGRTAILDTGTTLIVAPAADAAAVHKLIPGAQSDGQGGFTVPCTTNASVALSFGGRSFAIDPRDIAPLPVSPNDPAGTCTSGIVSGNVGGGAQEWLVGDVFLKNAYFSTDVGKNTISLAKLV
ncbi:aspartic peptidase domain-containing protein [Gautieria morchelliformis]|nr:aspartic peptidase domain-containing protein [Gautieria morchelliformis]